MLIDLQHVDRRLVLVFCQHISPSACPRTLDDEPSRISIMTFYPKRSSAIWLLLGCSAFVAAGIWMGFRGEWFGYVCAGFFGLGIPVAVIQLLPGSAFLQIDSSGITYASLFRKTSIPWSVIDDFCVVAMRQTGVKVHEMVGFNFVPSHDRSRFGRGVSKAIAGCEGALPDTYGMQAVDLAAMLTSRLRAVREQESGPQNELRER